MTDQRKSSKISKLSLLAGGLNTIVGISLIGIGSALEENWYIKGTGYALLALNAIPFYIHYKSSEALIEDTNKLKKEIEEKKKDLMNLDPHKYN